MDVDKEYTRPMKHHLLTTFYIVCSIFFWLSVLGAALTGIGFLLFQDPFLGFLFLITIIVAIAGALALKFSAGFRQVAFNIFEYVPSLNGWGP